MVQPLFEEELLLAVPENTPNLPPPPESWIDSSTLSQEMFILTKEGHHTRFLSDQLFQQYGFAPKSIVETANIETAVGMANNGMGLTFVPSYFSLMNANSGSRLKFYSIGLPPCRRTVTSFCLIHRRGIHLTKYARSFIDIMREEFSGKENLL